MNSLADSSLQSGDKPFFTVVIWNVDRTSRKIWKNCSSQAEADLTLAALRVHQFDAEILPVGETAYGSGTGSNYSPSFSVGRDFANRVKP